MWEEYISHIHKQEKSSLVAIIYVCLFFIILISIICITYTQCSKDTYIKMTSTIAAIEIVFGTIFTVLTVVKMSVKDLLQVGTTMEEYTKTEAAISQHFQARVGIIIIISGSVIQILMIWTRNKTIPCVCLGTILTITLLVCFYFYLKYRYAMAPCKKEKKRDIDKSEKEQEERNKKSENI